MNEVFNDLVVVKRSGQRVSFNSPKIAIAIKKAFEQVPTDNYEKKVNNIYNEVLDYIKDNYKDRKTINVEDIQDIIENKLKENNYILVYQAFNEYRMRRAISRKAFNIKQQHKFASSIEKIAYENIEKNNSNLSKDILLNFGKTISCEYAKNYILDTKLVRAHEEGSIYIHNLDYFWLGKLSSTNIIINDKLLKDFPSNFIAKLLNLKNEIDGEISINKINEILKKVLVKEFIKDFNKNINMSLDIAGFIEYINIKKINEIMYSLDSINIDIDIFKPYILNKKIEDIFNKSLNNSKKVVKEYLKNSLRNMLLILNDNKNENKKYSFSISSNNNYEELLISNIYLDLLNELDYLKNITTIVKIDKNTNKDIIIKVSNLIINKKNIAINFFNSSYNKNEFEEVEYFSNGKKIFENQVGEYKMSNGRMIVSSISINMARLGINNKNKNIKEFYKDFTEILYLVKNGLVSIFEIVGNKTKDNYRELFRDNIIEDNKLEDGQKIRKVIKRGILNLELAGLKECVMCLSNDYIEQKKLIKDIIKFVKGYCEEFSNETKLNFMVSETSKHRPLKKLLELDKVIYGINNDITNKECYERIDSMFKFEKDILNDLKSIGEYQKYLTGGNLTIIKVNSNSSIKNIINLIEMCLDNDIGFIKILLGDNYDY